VGFKAPTSPSGDQIWQLPDADGTRGQGLQTDGSGVLSFVDQGGGRGNRALVRTTADESRRSPTSLTADSELVVPAIAGKSYIIRGHIMFTTTGAADFRYSVSMPGTPERYYGGNEILPGGSIGA